MNAEARRDAAHDAGHDAGPQDAAPAPDPRRWAVYVHFPFCLHRCAYCDFATVAAQTIPRDETLAATLRELELRTTTLAAAPISSVFFGGGTPSLWGAEAIAAILRWLDRWAGFAADAEITIEANPGATEHGDLLDYAAAGVNRVSIGVQALDDRRLAALDRVHDAATAHRTLASLAGMVERGQLQSASADLIFGGPGQSMADLEYDLRAITAYALPHLSAYALTVEDGTPLARMVQRKLARPPDEDLQTEMLQAVPELLAAAGLERYEVSNFARPDKQCRHNLAYWRGDHYLAVGVGAHGFLPVPDGGIGERTANTRSIPRWLAASQQGRLAEDARERVDAESHRDELLLTGLRLAEGVDLARIERRLGATVREVIEQAARREADGALVVVGDRLVVAPPAWRRLDGVIASLSTRVDRLLERRLAASGAPRSLT